MKSRNTIYFVNLGITQTRTVTFDLLELFSCESVNFNTTIWTSVGTESGTVLNRRNNQRYVCTVHVWRCTKEAAMKDVEHKDELVSIHCSFCLVRMKVSLLQSIPSFHSTSPVYNWRILSFYPVSQLNIESINQYRTSIVFCVN